MSSERDLSNLFDMARVRISKRKLLKAVSPLLLLLALAGFALFMWTANVVLIRNSSGMTINEFTLTVCAKDYTLANISDGRRFNHGV